MDPSEPFQLPVISVVKVYLGGDDEPEQNFNMSLVQIRLQLSDPRLFSDFRIFR